jgi:hypothetical protein
MANTYTLIEAKTISSAVSSVTFTSIPQTYTDLNLLFSIRSSRAAVAENILLAFNGSTSSFTNKVLIGQGNSGIDNTTTARYGGFATGDTATANVFANNSLYIPNYTSSEYKSYSVDAAEEDNAGLAFVGLGAGLWSNTAAITSIEFTLAQSNNFKQYCTFYLYGIKNS